MVRRSRFLPVAVAAALLCSPSCKSSSDDDDDKDEAAADDDDDGDDDDGGGGPGDMFGPLAKMLGEGLDKPGPYDEPRHSEHYADGVAHYAVLELDDTIGEVESFSLFDPEVAEPLRDVTEKLRALASDDKVSGVVLRSTGMSLDMAQATELRIAVIKLKEAGKFVGCHTENIHNAAYHVFSVCDSIGLAPLGEIVVTGAAATPVHVKGLLDRLSVTADFLHIGDYKGAAEPLTREAPSEQMLETLKAIVDQAYETQVSGLVDGRGLTREQAVAAIDNAIFVDSAAVDADLADMVATWEAYLKETTGDKPWKLERDADDSTNPLAQMMKLQRFLGLMPPSRPLVPHIALVYAVGNVVDGKGGGAVGARTQIASRTLSATLRALGRDEDVEAVVLRVDSPGGSALASEQIHEAVAEVVAKKPVVVSMGSVAASGGYYISAGATKIFATPDTVTGSIGVVGGKIVIGDALEQFGVKTYEVHRGERALIWSSMDPWTEPERAAVREMMETTYERFLQRVATGRKMERDAVHELAQGRVWTGAAAKDNGLVDELGGLDAAIAAAHELGGVAAGTELEVYPGTPTLRDLLGSLSQIQSQIQALAGVDGRLQELAQVAGPGPAAQVARILRLVTELRHTHIWAVSWVQAPR